MNARLFAKRNASTVLTCLGGDGIVVTTVLAVKATPKALQLIEEEKQKKGEELSKWEVVKTAGPKYIPTVLMGGIYACLYFWIKHFKQTSASIFNQCLCFS